MTVSNYILDFVVLNGCTLVFFASLSVFESFLFHPPRVLRTSHLSGMPNAI